MRRNTLIDHQARIEPRGGRRTGLVRGAAGTAAAIAATVLVGLTGAARASAATSVSTAPVVAFQAAGDVGGGVLQPGTLYSPPTHGFATLKRGSDWIQVNIQTSGLPAGAYTVWWVVFDTPEGCVRGCGADDLFNPDANVSVFFATGGVVHEGAAASFRSRHRVGDDLGEPGTQQILGDGSLDPSRAEIHNIIKYHGPASDDPATLHQQTHTLLGGCFEGANAVDLGEPFGVQCFDPQAVAHPLP
jgi:hypothetical protein